MTRNILLYPFTLLYWLAVMVRNFLFDIGLRKQYSPPVPNIVVGNIEAGGTGKTPHSEYLIALLSIENNVAFLSRGYKRKSKGFILAGPYDTADTIGDEPLQVFQRFPEISVAVDVDRVHGIKKLIEGQRPNIIVLDDAFQHRRVKPGFSILLTSYHRPFWDDYMIPMGRLREPSSSIARANAVIITKSPDAITPHKEEEIRNRFLPFPDVKVFFSSIEHGEPESIGNLTKGAAAIPFPGFSDCEILLVTGIVNTTPLTDHLAGKGKTLRHIAFGDHHAYKPKDIDHIIKEFTLLEGSKKLIITTAKDAVKLKEFTNFGLLSENDIFYIPLKIVFNGNSGSKFDKMITDYAGANK